MVFMRSIILSAWVMPGVVIGIVWAIILNEASYGLANLLLAPVGSTDSPGSPPKPTP